MPFVQVILLENIGGIVRANLPPSATTIHTIEKCFVDLNFQLNENVNSSFSEKSVFFTRASYDIIEGSIGNFFVSLDSPSQLGIEELDLYFLGSSTGATINGDALFGYNFNEPLRLSWSGGEQVKAISVTGLTDFSIENTESFYFKLDHFTNCVSGGLANTAINIINLTTFPTAYIESTNGSYIQNPEGVYKLNFGINEGDSKNIQISLSYPSILGQEEVDVVFVNETASSIDYQTSITQPIHLTWTIGEQVKIINVAAILDSEFFESSLENLIIRLQNPINTDINLEPITIPNSGVGKFPFASIQIYNQEPIIEYARVYLTPFATQPGRSNSSVYLKLPYTSYDNGYAAIENQKFITYQATAPDTYNPPFSLYGIQNLNNFNDDKLSLEIKNLGTTQAIISGSVLNVGEIKTITGLGNTYYIDLPANLSQITNAQNETIVTGARYEITLNMQYVGNSSTFSNTYTNGVFSLKNLNNTNASSNKKFQIGIVELNTYPEATYTNLANAYRATTKFSGIGTGRSGNSCPVFSFNNAAIENAQVDGIYFIDFYSTTQYTGIEFLQNGGIDATCNSSQYTIPYKILP
jgi:hypothetical protein